MHNLLKLSLALTLIPALVYSQENDRYQLSLLVNKKETTYVYNYNEKSKNYVEEAGNFFAKIDFKIIDRKTGTQLVEEFSGFPIHYKDSFTYRGLSQISFVSDKDKKVKLKIYENFKPKIGSFNYPIIMKEGTFTDINSDKIFLAELDDNFIKQNIAQLILLGFSKLNSEIKVTEENINELLDKVVKIELKKNSKALIRRDKDKKVRLVIPALKFKYNLDFSEDPRPKIEMIKAATKDQFNLSF